MAAQEQIDPLKLSLTGFVRLINSTKQNPAVYIEKIKRYMDLGGYYVGDGKNFNLYRFAAWYFDYTHDRPDKIKNRRDYEASRRESKRMESNDIGEIPPVVDPERRKRCEADPVLWLQTYLGAEEFYVPFTSEQEGFIRDAWEAIKNNDSCNILAPRGFGKTTDLQGLTLMAYATGIHKIGIYIVAEGNKTKEASEWFVGQLEDNPIFAEDYPEICYPIKIRDGVAQKPLHYKGKRCNIKISPEFIRFPSIDGSPSNGSLIKFSSIFSSGIRGSKFRIRGEGSFRPTLVLVDDVQSDGTAKSELEVGKIMEVIEKTLALLGGVDKKTHRKVRAAMVMALTQNQPNDVAVRCLAKPELYTKVFRFFNQLPEDFTAWRAYRAFRAEAQVKSKSAGEADKIINEYYLAHRSEIERDCVVANQSIYTDKEICAIQYGLNTWCNSIVSFWCELQNDAERAYTEDGGFLTPTIVLRKTNHLPRYVVPDNTELLTAFIDTGEHYHNYQVTAFGESYSFIHTVDCGVWPEQNIPHINKSSYHVDLQDYYHDGKRDKPAMIRKSIYDCLEHIMTAKYVFENGDPVPVNDETEYEQHATKRKFKHLSAIGVDAKDVDLEPLVWNAISDFHAAKDVWFGRAIPTYGSAAQARLFRYLPLRDGEWRRGAGMKGECDWIENPETKQITLAQNTRAVKVCLKFDANTYKTLRDVAWMMSPDKIGSHTLFNDKPEWLQMYANHQCAEEYVMRRIGEYDYRAYHMKKPHFSDNDFFDCDTGCVMLASYVGIESKAMVVRRTQAKPKMSREEYARAMSARLNNPVR